MSFLNPFLLLGILAVAVPLLIHLVYLRRPTRIRFSTLVFFDALKASTLRNIRLKRWLLLALRMAAILLLSIALAGPFIGFGDGDPEGRPAVIGILIDNSPSMDQVDRNGPFFDQAQRVASEIVASAGHDDRILLEVTSGAGLEAPPLTRMSAGARIAELATMNQGSFPGPNMAGLISRMERSPEPVRRLYLITDGQAGPLTQLAGSEAEWGQDHALQVITVGEETQGNVAVTGIELMEDRIGPDEPVTVRAAVQNFGSSPVRNHFISLEVDGDMSAQHVVNLEAGEGAEYRFELLLSGNRSVTGSVLLEGDEFTFDNRRYFSLGIPEQRRVLLVQEEGAGGAFPSFLPPLLDAALSGNDILEVERGGWESVRSGEEAPDAIILDGVTRIPDNALDILSGYVQTGGGLLFLPSADGEMQSYNRFLDRTNAGRFTGTAGTYGSFESIDRLSRLTEGHPVLEDVFDRTADEDLRVNLPDIFHHYTLDPSARPGSFRFLESESGAPILMEYSFGEGLLMVSSIGTDPGWSDLPIVPLFAPLFYRSILYLASSECARLLEHRLGGDFEFRIPGGAGEVLLVMGEQSIIPERSSSFEGLTLRDQARDWSPGMAELVVDGKNIPIAVNQHTMESDFTALEQYELMQTLETLFQEVSVRQITGSDSRIAEQVRDAGFSQEIWYWFILGAIILLLTESAIARLFKAETI